MVEVERVFNDIDIELLDYDIVFHGEIVDDRGGRLLDKIRDKDISVYQVRYDSHNFSLILNNVGYPVNDMAKWFSSVAGKNILIDVTTLDFPEILYLIHWINDASSSSCIDALYIETRWSPIGG